MRRDWVYRPNEIAETLTNFGAYGGSRALNVGASNSASFILYDSVDYLRFDTESNNLNQGFQSMPRAARAEGSLPTVFAVQGTLHARRTAWTLQSFIRFAFRLGWYEQDMTSGLLSLEADYTLWDRAGFFLDHAPAIFANEKNSNLMERRWAAFSDSADAILAREIPVLWRGRRRAPSSKHCLALYLEAPEGGASFSFIESWCRSLIADEG